MAKTLLEYIEETVAPTIQMCQEQARIAKYRYRGMQITVVIVAAAIPAVGAIASAEDARWVSAILGSIVAATAGLIQMFKYLEEWLMFKSAGASLASELNQYQLGVGDYRKLDQPSRDALFVERIEAKVMELETKYSNTHSGPQLTRLMKRYGIAESQNRAAVQ